MTNLKTILSQGENLQIEFKEKITSPKSFAAEMAALANSKGGDILIGVSDDGKIKGIKKTQKLEEHIINIARNNCEPSLLPEFSYQEIDGKTVGVLHIYQSSEPHRVKDGKFYIRAGSTKREASIDEIRRLFQTRGKVQFDESPVANSSLDDLDRKLFNDYYEKVFKTKPPKAELELKKILLKNLILTQEEKKQILTIAGLLVFGQNPQQFLHYSGITLMNFRGSKKAIKDKITGLELEGNLPSLIQGVDNFIKTNLKIKSKMQGFKRIDIPEIPFEVIREAVVNAVCHRDYSIFGAKIRIFIFKDRMEIRSPGRLPNTMELKNLGDSPPFARNQLIVGFMNRLGYIENIGQGILLMREQMMKHNKTLPIFKEVGAEFVVILRK